MANNSIIKSSPHLIFLLRDLFPHSTISLCWQVSSGYLVVVFVYVTEFTGSNVRTWTSMHVHAAFAVGVMIVALVGYLVRIWWLYQVILTLSTSPFLLYCWKFPETPFYLMAKGRHQEAQELLDTMARWNGMEPRLKVLTQLHNGNWNGTFIRKYVRKLS